MVYLCIYLFEYKVPGMFSMKIPFISKTITIILLSRIIPVMKVKFPTWLPELPILELYDIPFVQHDEKGSGETIEGSKLWSVEIGQN